MSVDSLTLSQNLFPPCTSSLACRARVDWHLGPRSSPPPWARAPRAQSQSTSTSPRTASQIPPRFRRHYSARTYATGRPMPFAMTVATVPSPCCARTAPTAPIAALESLFFFFSFRRRRRRRRQHHGCHCPRCRHPRRRPCCQHSLPDQRSLAGTSNATAAGVTPPHETMRRISSRPANQRRLHHPTARHQGGWAALQCPGRPAPSLPQAFELRSYHRLAPCPPSQGACASRSLWRGRGMKRWAAAKLSFNSGMASLSCRPTGLP